MRIHYSLGVTAVKTWTLVDHVFLRWMRFMPFCVVFNSIGFHVSKVNWLGVLCINIAIREKRFQFLHTELFLGLQVLPIWCGRLSKHQWYVLVSHLLYKRHVLRHTSSVWHISAKFLSSSLISEGRSLRFHAELALCVSLWNTTVINFLKLLY